MESRRYGFVTVVALLLATVERGFQTLIVLLLGGNAAAGEVAADPSSHGCGCIVQV